MKCTCGGQVEGPSYELKLAADREMSSVDVTHSGSDKAHEPVVICSPLFLDLIGGRRKRQNAKLSATLFTQTQSRIRTSAQNINVNAA